MSGGISLFPFQVRAAQQIANRYLALVADRRRPMEHRDWPTPFYQSLSALTGAGKTPILADAVEQIRSTMPMDQQPIVLWISKAKAVVDQTYANLESGGKYRHIIGPFNVDFLSNVTRDSITDGSSATLLLSTVGAIYRSEAARGALLIHRSGDDDGDTSLWDELTKRESRDGMRRSLIVVYDEGHNLTDQQADLLLDLEPDAILVAGATLRPLNLGRLGRVVDRLRQYGWTDDALSDDKNTIHQCLKTIVSSKAVVEAGLVKQQVVIGASMSNMEAMLDEMLESMEAVKKKAVDLDAGFEPKAIYVCKTNINQDDGTPDLPSRPFGERRAPPILIWRHLVDRGVDPKDIAVYCELRFERTDNPPPEEFNLFSGGEQDFAVFTAGNYKHVIFNLSLQEGWDDPAVSFAYIDKSMGSSVQVEQIIGRALRQPGARHYPDVELNTATFFVRVDDRQEFPRILAMVRSKLGAELPDVEVRGYEDSRDRQRATQQPKQALQVPEIHIDAADAEEAMASVMEDVHDYRRDVVNTVGQGDAILIKQAVGGGGQGTVQELVSPHSNRVMARWVVRREMRTLFPRSVAAVEWDDRRFDARVEITSAAASALRDDAEKLVDAYLEGSSLVFEEGNPYLVGALHVNPAKAKPFRNALHDSYDLNGDEQPVAEALDATGHLWTRNPSQSGYSIPLLDKGDTQRFFPDFLVWKDGIVFALDPKAPVLLAKDAGAQAAEHPG